MNFRPKNESYIRDQKKIERAPTIRTDFYFLIDDMSKKLLSGMILTEKEIIDLEMVYDLTQDLDKDIIYFMENQRSLGVVSKEEALVVTNCLIFLRQNGSDISKLKEVMANSSEATINDYVSALSVLSVPENSRRIILDSLKKVVEDSSSSKSDE
jgi:hypothetical protein